MFEIEKRSLFASKKEFENFKKQIAKQAEFVANYFYKTFLFNEPEYIRIRISTGKNKAEITKKEGGYNSPTRKETNNYIDLAALPEFIKKIKSQGFKKCVCVQTESHVYKINNLTIALNNISDLGMIVEVEALTNDETKVPDLEEKVSGLMKELGLKELGPQTYQSMMNTLYSKATDISKQNFSL